MKLNELRDNPGARKSRMRVGRGIGSGKGKTAGRGVQGPEGAHRRRASTASRAARCRSTAACRSAASTTASARSYAVVNLGALQTGDRRQASSTPASRSTRRRCRPPAWCDRRQRDGVRLLGQGRDQGQDRPSKVAGASASAVAAVEKAGGNGRSCRRPSRRGCAEAACRQVATACCGGRRPAAGAVAREEVTHGIRRRTARRQPQLRRPSPRRPS